jgi:hypothetical protein
MTIHTSSLHVFHSHLLSSQVRPAAFEIAGFLRGDEADHMRKKAAPHMFGSGIAAVDGDRGKSLGEVRRCASHLAVSSHAISIPCHRMPSHAISSHSYAISSHSDSIGEVQPSPTTIHTASLTGAHLDDDFLAYRP